MHVKQTPREHQQRYYREPDTAVAHLQHNTTCTKRRPRRSEAPVKAATLALYSKTLSATDRVISRCHFRFPHELTREAELTRSWDQSLEGGKAVLQVCRISAAVYYMEGIRGTYRAREPNAQCQFTKGHGPASEACDRPTACLARPATTEESSHVQLQTT